MAVYVDNMRASYRPAHRPGRTYVMSHMIADTALELHAMADRIGVARRWYQGDHYDVTQSKRRLAIRAGAIELSRMELGRKVIAARRARLPGYSEAIAGSSGELAARGA